MEGFLPCHYETICFDEDGETQTGNVQIPRNVEQSNNELNLCDYDFLNEQEPSDDEEQRLNDMDLEDMQYNDVWNNDIYEQCQNNNQKNYKIPTDVLKNLFCHFSIRNTLSRRTIGEMIDLMTLIYNSPPPFTKTDVVSHIKLLDRNYLEKFYFYCSSCQTKLIERKSPCKNPFCDQFKLPVKNGCGTSESSLVLYSFRQQLKDKLKPHFSEIIDFHRSLKIGLHDDYHHNDIRRSKRYKEVIETKEQLEENKITIVVSASFDGARPKRISKREFTPFVVRIESLPKEVRNQDQYIIITAMHSSTKGVGKDDIPQFTQRFVEELDEINRSGLLIENGDEKWIVKINVIGILVDLKAARTISDVPNWQAKLGCNHCKTEGKQVRAHVSFNQLGTSEMREDIDCIKDMYNKASGFNREWYCDFAKRFPPSKLFVELFHVKKEGVLKRCISEVFVNKWNWSKLKRGKLEILENCVKSTKSVTGFTDILPLSNRATCTGNQTQQMALITFPVAVAESLFENNQYSMFLITVLVFIWNEKNEKMFALLQELMNSGLKLIVGNEPDGIPLKFHLFFCHSVKHLELYGNAMDMEIPEKLHHSLQCGINLHSTNAFKHMSDRFLSTGILKTEIMRNIENLDPCLADIVSKLSLSKSGNFDGPRITIEMNVVDIDKNDLDEVYNRSDGPIHRFGSKGEFKLTNGKKVMISSEKYMHLSTTQSIMEVLVGTEHCFVNCQLLLENENGVFMLCQKYKTTSFAKLIQDTYGKMKSSSCDFILSCIDKFETPFERIDGHFWTILPMDNIINYYQEDRSEWPLEYGYNNGNTMTSEQSEFQPVTGAQYTELTPSPPPISSLQTASPSPRQIYSPQAQSPAPNRNSVHRRPYTENTVIRTIQPRPISSPREPYTQENLNKCIINGKLNVFQIGKMAEIEGQQNYENYSTITNEFVKSQAGSITGAFLPPEGFHPMNTHAVTLGNFILAQLNSETNKILMSRSRSKSTIEFTRKGSLTGVSNPVIPLSISGPFKAGFQIPMMTLKHPSDKLKNGPVISSYAYQMLSLVCDPQEEIQKYTWTTKNFRMANIEGENEDEAEEVDENGRKFIKLPDEMNKMLKAFFLQYYDLDDSLIVDDSMINLQDLSANPFFITLGSNVNERLAELNKRRIEYIAFESLYDQKLKETMKELRNSTLINVEKPYFKRRSHNSMKRKAPGGN